MIESIFRTMDEVRAKRRTQKIRRKEKDQFQHSFPELVNKKQQLDDIAQQYAAAHAAYTTGISDTLNAISLRQAALLAFLVRTRSVTRLLDTGSGFSSFVLGSEAKCKHNVRHLAVEDNEFWRSRTKEFLRENGLPAENVISWKAFQADSSLCGFDLIFHDLGNMTTRILSLREIESRLAPSCWLILDDMHKSTYCPHALRLLGERWIVQSLVDLTLDEVGRFAYICRQRPRQ
jgi:predicted O-methyltransferase YrrM